MSKSTKKAHQHLAQTGPAAPLLVDPLWMAKAVGAVIIVAGVCAYAVICALFWHGQWQIVLSPSRIVAATPASLGLPFQEVKFAPGTGGQTELTGWWIPAAEPNAVTVLAMHGGSGSMSDMLTQVHILHDNGLNVLVFDYHGFGKSAGSHPTQRQMERDTTAALQYLETTRHVSSSSVVAFGEGLGASLATKLCEQHQDIGALILENADGDFETRAVLDERSRLVPVSLLFSQTFPLADPLHTLATPKLLISYTKNATPPVDFSRAGDPKLTVEISSSQDAAALSVTLRRFLDSYVERQPPVLIPQH